MTPSPSTYHQTLSRRLQFQLYRLIEETGLGQVFDAPTDVQLSEFDIVQPDLLVILEDRKHIITPRKIKGAPDLVVEILSESSAAQDLGSKLTLYARSHVPEYWVVDPDEHLLSQYLLEGDSYRLEAKHSTAVNLRRLPGINVDLVKVW